MQVIRAGPFPISRVSLSGCGRWVGVVRHGRPGRGGCDLWDRRTGRVVFTAGVRQCATAVVHPSGETFLGWGEAGGGLRVMPTADPHRAAAVEPESTLTELHAAADGRRLVGFHRWPRTGGYLTGWATNRAGRPRRVWGVAVPDRVPGELAVSPDGGLAAVHLRDHPDLFPGRLEVRFAHDGTPAAACEVRGWCRLLAVRDNGLTVATVPTRYGSDGRADAAVEVGLLDVEGNRWVGRRPLPDGAELTAAVSPDGRQLLVPVPGGAAVLDADTLHVCQSYALPTPGQPTCVAFAPDGLTAACGTSKGEVVIWGVD